MTTATNITESNPQTLLSRGNLSFARYQVKGNDKINSRIMVKSLNKISIAQHRGGQ